ncbi:MAG: bifunctional 4-hydroxy-2-oxoglutarate aldolase/2-dehydro-3-deoxy-phosphogluconate aldolase [Caldilineaceae bacterium]|nr:bifunctional 4-hydroxy-2-oxoglutarate aldolase/2-dehydro-3-deoxy-phosphogluconate aldolase [Caldilineaceae bacterium]HRJ41684.1 bifunctional 4-hydroxy-2-oxoglutarate aldolase/2-dehydro-3-deoxy-phosphogluconate aldolase [Caldilineaceae bacterium]
MAAIERRVSVAETVEWLKREGIIPIVRGDFAAERVLEIGDALLAAPILCMEVTMNTPGATQLIGLLRARYGERMRIGAGTVRTVAQLEVAVEAGAQFTLSPSLVLAVVERAQALGVLHIPGVYTASEAETAWQAGCPILKLFPADQGGPTYLKALRAPLDDIAFAPTGGVSMENAAAWRAAGAVALGVGSTLITGPQQAMTDLIARARGLKKAWEGEA